MKRLYYMKFSWVVRSSVVVLIGYAVIQFFSSSWQGSCEFRFQNAVCTTMRPGTQAIKMVKDGRAVLAIKGTVFQHVRTPRQFECVMATITYTSDSETEFGFQFGPQMTDFSYTVLPKAENWQKKTIEIFSENLRYNEKDQRYQVSYRNVNGNLWVDSFEITGKTSCKR